MPKFLKSLLLNFPNFRKIKLLNNLNFIDRILTQGNSSANKLADPGFFDKYPVFYESSQTSAAPNRLNRRVEVLIENNKDLIKDKNILDIASHDGRFSFAAIKQGAKHVLGIEGKQYLIENSNKNMEKYDIPKNRYTFLAGDIHKEIEKIEPNEIDTVFCFGFFYHTFQHLKLLSEIKRLEVKNLIIDSNVLVTDRPLILVKSQSGGEGSAIPSENTKGNKTLVGLPAKSAIELMLDNLRFSFQSYDWKKKDIRDWKNLQDYQTGNRVTIIAKNLD